MQQDSNKTPVD